MFKAKPCSVLVGLTLTVVLVDVCGCAASGPVRTFRSQRVANVTIKPITSELWDDVTHVEFQIKNDLDSPIVVVWTHPVRVVCTLSDMQASNHCRFSQSTRFYGTLFVVLPKLHALDVAAGGTSEFTADFPSESIRLLTEFAILTTGRNLSQIDVLGLDGKRGYGPIFDAIQEETEVVFVPVDLKELHALR